MEINLNNNKIQINDSIDKFEIKTLEKYHLSISEN
jgi:hypothetical protein